MVKKSSPKEHEEMVGLMQNFFETDKPKVGIFWYDYVNNTLFGVEKDDADKYETEHGKATLPKLHKTYWQKQHHRAVAKGETNSIFYQEHDYTKIPRGRIFLEEGKFTVMVGNWIDQIDQQKLRELIQDEFNLPEDFTFKQDYHWNLGHGWSEEFI